MGKTVALILAGGRGIRAGGGVPKQYRDISGVPLLRLTLRAFADHPAIDSVRAVIHPDDEALCSDECTVGGDCAPSKGSGRCIKGPGSATSDGPIARRRAWRIERSDAARSASSAPVSSAIRDGFMPWP